MCVCLHVTVCLTLHGFGRAGGGRNFSHIDCGKCCNHLVKFPVEFHYTSGIYDNTIGASLGVTSLAPYKRRCQMCQFIEPQAQCSIRGLILILFVCTVDREILLLKNFCRLLRWRKLNTRNILCNVCQPIPSSVA